MTVISAAQMDALGASAAERFTNEMVAHAKAFVPERCRAWGEPGTVAVVRRALHLASAHGFDLRGPMRLVVEAALIYGPNFDQDPHCAPMLAILSGQQDQMHRAESLHAWMVDDLDRAVREPR